MNDPNSRIVFDPWENTEHSPPPTVVPKRRSTDRPRDYSARRAAIAAVAFAIGVYAAWAVFAGWLP